MRTKRISQCCSVSHKRESQAIDLLLTRYENQFLSQYIGLISQNVNWYSFSYCLETFENEFIQNANGYIQIQLQKEFTYDKSCPKVIPENLYVFFFIVHFTQPYYWSALLEYLSVLGVYEQEMDKTKVRRSLLSRLFKKATDEEILQKMEAPVEDKNSDLEFILSPTYVV